MADMYYDSDADLALLKGKKIGIIGFGSQGHAHALNLKDSGLDVVVGLYPGSKSWKACEENGVAAGSVADVAQEADVIMMLVPDQTQKQVYEEFVEPGLSDGKMLMFSGELGAGNGIYFYSLVGNPGHPAFIASYPVGTGVHTATFAEIGGKRYVFAAKDPGAPALLILDVTGISPP